MISVKEAEEIILNNLILLPIEQVHIKEALNRVLAEDVLADRDFPPFDRVMMDGIAIRHADWVTGQRAFTVSAVNFAGMAPVDAIPVGACVEVMTGSVLPSEVDTVIRYEDVSIQDGAATIGLAELERGANVHPRAADKKEKDLLLAKNTVIYAPELSLLATVGKSLVSVYKLPKVSIVSTGDELVAVNEQPLEYQIRTSNAYAIQARLKECYQVESEVFHIDDDKTALTKKIQQIVSDSDVVIMSGGVSRGKKDYVPEVLESLNVVKHFHKVKQRPGKPFWFGTLKNKVFFALPGNPVSTFLCLNKYVLPWLDACLHQAPMDFTAQLAEKVVFDKPLTNFMQVRAAIENATCVAYPVKGQGSGDLANLAEVNAFVELEEAHNEFESGSILRLIPFKKIVN